MRLSHCPILLTLREDKMQVVSHSGQQRAQKTWLLRFSFLRFQPQGQAIIIYS